jgi:outer membrane protein OmpA-like peptidoglycan-associated protein
MSQARHRIAGLATLASLLLGGSALAQEVHIFEEAPPLELLRSIMVPESRPGLSRRIVLGEPMTSAPAPAPAPNLGEPVASAAEPDPERTAEAPAQRRPRRHAAPGPQFATAGNTLPLPAPAATTPATAGTIGFRINFALNSDAVPPSAFPFLDRVGELMREQPQLKLQVEGHTDALGSDSYNLQLSQRRAASVAGYLMQRQGVELARLVVLGMGEGKPLVENGYDPRNRRVQFARVE